MKKVEHYICEVCGTEYRDKESCQTCEAGHHKPVKISGAKWVALKNDKKGYPTKIHVTMSNGETVTYTR